MSVGKLTRVENSKGKMMVKIVTKESVFSDVSSVLGDDKTGGISSIELTFDKNNKVFKNAVLLYSNEEYKNVQKQSYEEGYDDGYEKAFEEGYKKCLSELKDKVFKEGYEKGLTDSKSIKNNIKKIGTVRGKEGRKREISDSKISAILNDSKQTSCRKVAEKHGVSRQTVLNIIHRKGRFEETVG